MGRPSVVAAWAPPGRTQAGPGARSACSAAEGQVNIADEAVRAPVRTGWLWSAERLLRSGGQGQHRGRGRPRSGARRLALERGAPAPQRRGRQPADEAVRAPVRAGCSRSAERPLRSGGGRQPADEAVRAPVRTGWPWSAERLLRSSGGRQPADEAVRAPVRVGWPWSAERLLRRGGPTTRGRGRLRSGARRLASERGAPAPQRRARSASLTWPSALRAVTRARCVRGSSGEGRRPGAASTRSSHRRG